jgi:hypothetical protein
MVSPEIIFGEKQMHRPFDCVVACAPTSLRVTKGYDFVKLFCIFDLSG